MKSQQSKMYCHKLKFTSDFHVKDAMKAAAHKYQNEAWDDILEPAVLKLIHAYTKADYDIAYEELKKVANEAF